MNLTDLKKMLGLDSEADQAVDRFDKFGMLPAPPQKRAAYSDADGGIGWSPDLEGAKTMAEGSQNVRTARSSSMRDAASGAQPAWALDEASANRASENMLRSKRDAPPGDEQADSPNPPVKHGPPAALLEAFRKVGVDPETTDAPDVPEGQQPRAAGNAEPMRRPAGMIGPMATARTNRPMPEENSFNSPDYRAQLNDPNRKIFADISERIDKRGGGQNDQLAQLRAALEKKNQRYAQADASHEAGVGADIAHGTHFNANAGEGLRKTADAEAEGVSKQIDTEEQMGKYASDQATADLNRSLKTSDEKRSVSEEGRKQKTFETTQADSDASSQTSANARASVASLYPKAWNQIPQDLREKFSAKDVQRIFGELAQEKTKGGGGLSSSQQIADDRNLRDFEANLPQPSTIDAYKRISGRLQDKTPIYGMGSGAKALQGGLSAIPIVGKSISDYAGGAMRGLTPEGQQLQRDAIIVMQQLTLDTTGKAMNERELKNIETRLGMAAGNENSFRAALQQELESAKAKAERQLAARNPRVQQMAKERGIMPDWTPRGGGVMPYALENEGRFDEADEAAKKKGPFKNRLAPQGQ